MVLFGLSLSSLSPSAHVMAIPAILWLSIALVGALTLTRIFDREREADTLRAMLVAPVERVAVYFGKAIVTFVVVLGCAVITVLGLVLLFPAAGVFFERPLATVALVALGAAAYAVVGTLFAAGLATSSGKNVILSIILYPLTTPVLLFGLVATRALLENHPAFIGYIQQLAAVVVILAVVSAWLFESVLVGVGDRRRRWAGSTNREVRGG
jgi:heme exporter protein B